MRWRCSSRWPGAFRAAMPMCAAAAGIPGRGKRCTGSRQDPGLLGYGRIAQAFERKMRASASRASSSSTSTPICRRASRPPRSRLCREADYLSLHAPLTAETRHILGAERLALLKPTAIVVNTSRGALIDEEALAAALREGRRGFGAGLDVFETEPPAVGHPLLRLPNVVLSDHAGWYSEESVAELQRKAAEEVARILSGQPPLNWTNRWTGADAA